MNVMTGSEAADDDRAAHRPEDPVDESATARATVDPHGIVTGWSEGARRLLGHRSTEVIGRPAAPLLAGEPPSEALRSLHTLPRWNGAATLLHRDAHHLTVNLLPPRRQPPSEHDVRDECLLVSPLARPSSPLQDDPLLRWAFTQSPATSALYDTGLRLRRGGARETGGRGPAA